MAKKGFALHQENHQITWRKTHISTPAWGYHGKNTYPHIIPKKIWTEALWEGIRVDLPKYLIANMVQPHSGVNNLQSSWIACANLYFPVRIFPDFKKLMLEFLQKKVSSEIIGITDVELEFAFADELGPAKLLGELDGSRGSGQTSPDVAFVVKTKTGEGVILTECKYTEHSFYSCSARTTEDSERRPKNPDPDRCMKPAMIYIYKKICHQTIWRRKYWSHLHLSSLGLKNLTRCPAATAGYQLFRQQALAEGISNSGRFSLVASTVAFDARNTNLIGCMKTTGIPDFQVNWSPIYTSTAIFKTWTHQEWVDFVRTKKGNPDWLQYIKERYDY